MVGGRTQPACFANASEIGISAKCITGAEGSALRVTAASSGLDVQ
jgi:hypothetical protein